MQGPASWKLKKVDVFIVLGAFFFELSSLFSTVLIICIFPINFSEKENQGAIRLFIHSMKVKCPGPGFFGKFSDFQDFQDFLKICVFFFKQLAILI